MNRTIAIWGNSGSGKTTLTVNLACVLAENNMVGVISANDFGEIQTFFGQGIPNDKGIYNAFYGQHKDIKHTFHEMENAKNVFVLAPATKCDAIKLSLLDSATAYDIITNADRYFDILLIDCTTNKNNAVTGTALSKAHTVLVPITPIISTSVWHTSNAQIFSLIANKTKYIKYAQNSDCDIDALCDSMGIKTSYEIPHIEKARYYQNEGKPIFAYGIKAFNRKLNDLAKELLNQEVCENEQK